MSVPVVTEEPLTAALDAGMCDLLLIQTQIDSAGFGASVNGQLLIPALSQNSRAVLIQQRFTSTCSVKEPIRADKFTSVTVELFPS